MITDEALLIHLAIEGSQKGNCQICYSAHIVRYLSYMENFDPQASRKIRPLRLLPYLLFILTLGALLYVAVAFSYCGGGFICIEVPLSITLPPIFIGFTATMLLYEWLKRLLIKRQKNGAISSAPYIIATVLALLIVFPLSVILGSAVEKYIITHIIYREEYLRSLASQKADAEAFSRTLSDANRIRNELEGFVKIQSVDITETTNGDKGGFTIALTMSSKKPIVTPMVSLELNRYIEHDQYEVPDGTIKYFTPIDFAKISLNESPQTITFFIPWNNASPPALSYAQDYFRPGPFYLDMVIPYVHNNVPIKMIFTGYIPRGNLYARSIKETQGFGAAGGYTAYIYYVDDRLKTPSFTLSDISKRILSTE